MSPEPNSRGLTLHEAAEQAGFSDFLLAPGGGIYVWDPGYWNHGLGTYMTEAEVYARAEAVA